MNQQAFDQDFLEEVFTKYWPQVSYRVKSTIGTRNPDWEDICGEIITGLVETIKKKQYRGDAAIGTFIYSITTNKLIDYYRRKKRPLPHPEETFNAAQPHDKIERKQRREMLDSSLKQLRPRDADMVYLHYYMGLSQTEIGGMYGISAGRVSAIIKKARQRLRGIIEKRMS